MNKKLGVQSLGKKPVKKTMSNDKPKKTIGVSLVQGMLETKKIKLDDIEVSKRTFEQLENFAKGFDPPLTISQAVSRIIREFLED
ncbi:MAG: hypothetical protein SFU98_04300 [Leptospiraceae bacterium]|nr:hypothetical protein [Leptospiraceae bacterium]